MKCDIRKVQLLSVHLSAQKDVSVCNFENVRAIMSVSYQISDKDKIKKEDLEQKIKQSELPDYIFECFKVINCEDKIKIFASLKRLNFDFFALAEIKKCILKTQANSINYDGFQIVLDIILSIVKSKDIRHMIQYKGK